MAQRMQLPLTVSCFSKIQIGFTFLVPADPGSSGQMAIKWVCVCVCFCHLSDKQFVNVSINAENDNRLHSLWTHGLTRF